MIRLLEDASTNPSALSAQDDRQIPSEDPIVQLIQAGLRTETSGDDPISAIFHLGQRANKIRNSSHREPFNGSRRGPTDSRRQRRGPAIRQDQPSDSRRFRDACHGTDILRIFDAIERDQSAMPFWDGADQLEQLPQRELRDRPSSQRQSLMVPILFDSIRKLRSVDKLDQNSPCPRELGDLDLLLTLLSRSQPQTIESAASGQKGFSN
jgi:hypothetical protein